MSPDQGSEALFRGSKRNSGYQTVSKFYNLIVESSGSTRRIQRAQDRKNPTSVSQEIVHRTIHDQGVQYRPSVHNYPLLPRIYNPCHSRKTINRAPFYLEKGTQGLRNQRRLKIALAPLLLLDHRRTTARRPFTSPDHQSKALHFAGPPPDHRSKALHFVGPPVEGPSLRRTIAGPPAEGPILRRTTAEPPVEGPTLRRTTAGPPVEGPTLRSRPEVQPKALHPAQGPKSSLRPYAPLKA
ncbi:hypothetical protein M5K25_005787 [Dendrobium thyrsiflorum]|uniref:Uncharacterized protein n=1 Tax=Dendrobium thyrsiflorum TaxID=117978 RepID=A0ABD0VQ13_DENTH